MWGSVCARHVQCCSRGYAKPTLPYQNRLSGSGKLHLLLLFGERKKEGKKKKRVFKETIIYIYAVLHLFPVNEGSPTRVCDLLPLRISNHDVIRSVVRVSRASTRGLQTKTKLRLKNISDLYFSKIFGREKLPPSHL